jgi:hypothetical protein
MCELKLDQNPTKPASIEFEGEGIAEILLQQL